jgi:hydrogenase maturation protease
LKPDLRAELCRALEAACLVGVGNPDLGDDAFGVRLAEGLRAAGVRDAIVAGLEPERHVGDIIAGSFRNVVLLDAVEFPGEPGSAVLLDGASLEARFPQISTHKISLGTLARLIEGGSGARTWLLGVKPRSLRQGSGLSETVAATLDILRDLILDTLRPSDGAGERPERASIA